VAHRSAPASPWCASAAALSILGLVFALACGSEPHTPPVDVVAGSVTILAGDAQTDTAGAVLPTEIVIEVKDQSGAPLAGAEVWVGEILPDGAVPDGPADTTDANGLARYQWRPTGEARVHRLRAGVYDASGPLLQLLAADTINATVTPASPYSVEFTVDEETVRLLGEPADLAAVVGPVSDAYGNPVTVHSIAVDAPSPLDLNGTTVVSLEETQTLVHIVINGVSFPLWVGYRRDLRTMAGATGGWVCDSPDGAPTADPDVVVLHREVSVVVDSVKLRVGGGNTFYFTDTYHDEMSDGTTSAATEQQQRAVLRQEPGSWFWEFGPTMQQTSASPLRYDATEPDQCIAWTTHVGGPNSHQPLWLVR
jgi:hypothetical protein